MNKYKAGQFVRVKGVEALCSVKPKLAMIGKVCEIHSCHRFGTYLVYTPDKKNYWTFSEDRLDPVFVLDDVRQEDGSIVFTCDMTKEEELTLSTLIDEKDELYALFVGIRKEQVVFGNKKSVGELLEVIQAIYDKMQD